MKYFVYILQSKKNGSYYIGYAYCLEKRLKEHNGGLVKATKYKKPYILIYFEVYKNETEAKKREYYIKRQKSRKFIKELISKVERPDTSGRSQVRILSRPLNEIINSPC